MHLKRNKMPRKWPLTRKGTKYIVVPSHNKRKGVPLLIVLRDMLKIAKNRKEAKQILNLGSIVVNGKVMRSEKNPLLFFDTLSLKGDKCYRLTYSDFKKFKLEEISKEELDSKILKVVGKKILKGKTTQLSLNDGRTILTNEDIKTGNSVLVELKSNKIIKKIELSNKAKVIVIGGKHLGKKGTVEKIEEGKNMAEVIFKDKKLNVKLLNLMAIENGK
ncbi:MAG: KOW motif-containing protein [archaeon]